METIWIELANHFFLDTSVSENDWLRLSHILREQNLDRNQVQKILIEEVAPVAGKNLGYLIYPAIGVWTGFDESTLTREILKYKKTRKRRFSWHNRIRDVHTKWMLKQLDVEKLLSLLSN